MCACTQYYKLCYVDEIRQKENQIKKELQKFFETNIKNQIGLDCYTIDFAVSHDLQKIWVIEINNPPPVASCSLFDWHNDKERLLIMNPPLTFRILASPLQPEESVRQVFRAIVPYLKTLTPPHVKWPQEANQKPTLIDKIFNLVHFRTNSFTKNLSLVLFTGVFALFISYSRLLPSLVQINSRIITMTLKSAIT